MDLIKLASNYMKKAFAGSLVTCVIFVWASSALCQQDAFVDLEGSAIDTTLPGPITPTPLIETTGFVIDPKFAIAQLGDAVFEGNSTVEGRGTASAGNGHVTVEAQGLVTAKGGGATGSITTKAIADFSDSLTLHGGTPGSLVLLSGYWKLTGTVSSFATADSPLPPGVSPGDLLGTLSSSGNSALSISGTGISDTATQIAASSNSITRSLPVVSQQTDGPGQILVRIPVRVGSPFTLRVSLMATAFANAGSADFTTNLSSSGDSDADFSHTLGWGGITSVTDADGNPIADWSVTSDSGFDYSQPYSVPEPSAFALLAIMLPGLLLVGRYHRSRQSWPAHIESA